MFSLICNVNHDVNEMKCSREYKLHYSVLRCPWQRPEIEHINMAASRKTTDNITIQSTKINCYTSN